MEAVKLQPTQKDSLYFNKPIKIIRLETTPDSYLGGISKTIIDLPNDRIFIVSDFNLYIFDGHGKFITKLKQGKGPNEVISVPSFTVNRNRKTVYALDNASTIVELDYDGNFLNRMRIGEFYSIDMYCPSDSNLFLLCNWVGRKEKYFVGNYDLNKQVVTTKYVASSESDYPLNTFLTNKNFVEWDQEIYFCSANIFGLFRYEGDSFRRILTFDLGDRTVPPQFYRQFQTQNRDIFREEAKRKGYVPFLRYAFPFDGYFLVGIDDEQINCYAISRENHKIIYRNGPLSTYFKLPDTKSLRSPVSLLNNSIVFMCNPMDFFQNNPGVRTKTITIGGLEMVINYDENPFLVIIESGKSE